jgi:hypothetical protein
MRPLHQFVQLNNWLRYGRTEDHVLHQTGKLPNLCLALSNSKRNDYLELMGAHKPSRGLVLKLDFTLKPGRLEALGKEFVFGGIPHYWWRHLFGITMTDPEEVTRVSEDNSVCRILFAYDYPAMSAAMAPIRRQILEHVMHPSRLPMLPALQLVSV